MKVVTIGVSTGGPEALCPVIASTAAQEPRSAHRDRATHAAGLYCAAGLKVGYKVCRPGTANARLESHWYLARCGLHQVIFT